MTTRRLDTGMKINFFGVEYIISEIIDYDVVRVIQNNGVATILWFPDLPGRDIII